MNYEGIDYGLGQSNIDKETGIRYGVISSNGDILEAWADESEPYYGKVECPKCDKEVEPSYACSECEADLDGYSMLEPLGHVYTEGGYECEEGSDGDIFVLKSPYFTYAQFCSPCAPGAVHLENPLNIDATVGNIRSFDGNKGYCFGHGWFEGEKAPYKVYDVKTGKEVLALESAVETHHDRDEDPYDPTK